MFFRLLQLAGVDVNAKIAELKADLEFKIGRTSEEVTRRARTMGLVAGLFLSAGILALMVLIVVLIAIYKWGEPNYGAFVGLALVAGVLIILTATLVVAALSIAKQPSKIMPPAGAAEASPGGATRAALLPIYVLYNAMFRPDLRPRVPTTRILRG
jgi:hypothetical protein